MCRSGSRRRTGHAVREHIGDERAESNASDAVSRSEHAQRFPATVH
jgi:hypothetical protein